MKSPICFISRPFLSLRAITKVILLCSALEFIGSHFTQASPIPPTDNTAAPYMGIYGWGLKDTGIDHHSVTSAWLYRSKLWVEDAEGYDSWTTIEGEAGQLNAASYWLRENPGGTYYFTVCPLPGSGNTPLAGTSLALGATGTFNSHFTTLATKLVSKGLANNIIIRFGHEFNGTWYPWKVVSLTDAQNFAAYYQQVVTAMRGVTGASNLKFDFNGACAAWTSYNLSDAYPGDTYVDYIGCDIYDQCYAANTYPYSSGTYPYGSDASTRQHLAWTTNSGSSTHNNDLGLWKNFAASHSKPMTIPEWGVCSRSDNAGGLDDPYYIQQMYNFIQDPANNVYFHNYFDVQAPDGHHELTNMPGYGTTEFPNAALLFRQLFAIPPLPINNDIGTVGLSGSGGTVSVTGAGAGCLTGTSDNFHFSSKPVSGDDLLMVEITSMSSGTAAQSGIMLRQSSTANAAYAGLLVSNGNCVFQSRASAGAATVANTTITSIAPPVWLKLVRQGNGITGYQSPDGLNWSYVGNQTVTMTGTAYFGVAVASGTTTALNTTGIDNVNNFDIAAASAGSISNAIIMDDTASSGITKTGTWTSGTSPVGFYGTDYIHDGNTGKGTRAVTFSPNLPTAGQYDLYARWVTRYDFADNVPINIISTTGTSQAVANQKTGLYLWNYLGSDSFNSGTNGSIQVSNAGTNGYTIADAVMFVPRPLPTSVLPVADAYVRDGTYATTNFGTATTLDVKLDATSYSRDAFLKFNVSGLASITSARLQLMPTFVGTDTSATYTVEFVSDDTWTETGVTWNTKPAGSGTVLGTLSGLQTNVPVTVDITSKVKSEAAGDGVISIRIYSNSSGSLKNFSAGSREQTVPANQPQLIIQ